MTLAHNTNFTSLVSCLSKLARQFTEVSGSDDGLIVCRLLLFLVDGGVGRTRGMVVLMI